MKCSQAFHSCFVTCPESSFGRNPVLRVSLKVAVQTTIASFGVGLN